MDLNLAAINRISVQSGLAKNAGLSRRNRQKRVADTKKARNLFVASLLVAVLMRY